MSKLRREPQKKSSIPHELEQLRWDLAFSKDPEKKAKLLKEIEEYEQRAEKLSK